jgi:hypothetical protein
VNTNPQTPSQEKLSSANASAPDAICVIGMHRSGTSMIAKLLHECGLYLGDEDQLLGATSGNRDGHFEHKGFLEINDALLHHFGGSWEFPPPTQVDWQKDAALEPLRAAARLLVAGLSTRSPWGWKEPRTTVVLPFWKSIVPGMRFVICVRSPLEVARSLATRNKIPLEQGMILWHRYMRAALDDSTGCARIITHYEDFFADPETETDRLLRFCGMQRPEHVALIESGVRPELRHQRSEIAEILRLQAIPAEHKFFYLALRGLAREGLSATAGESGQAISELLRLLDEFRNQDRLAQLQAELADARNETARLRAERLNDLKANHRWAYRMWRNFIKPLRMR